MATQLIMTVGTNALPVWVAWYHLENQLPPPVTVRFVHTAGTTNVRNRLVRYCGGGTFGNHVPTSAGNPGTVRQDIDGHIISAGLPSSTTDVHVHYTGGTKVMGVETVAVLEEFLPNNINMATSYLDPRATSGPTIMDWNGNVLMQDARRTVQANLGAIALLNGFDIPPFGQYGPLTPPTPAELAAGQAYLSNPNQRLFTSATTVGSSAHGVFSGPLYSPDNLLEYGAYAAFKETLERIDQQSNGARSNYQLFHSVHVQRTGIPNARDFELDIVAVLGYQVVVVSCSVAKKASMIKLKAMEALHRAKQLGGDEAQAVMLARPAQGNNQPGIDPAQVIEDELKNDMGSASEPLKVWGSDKWATLSNEFYDYLTQGLFWR